MAFGQYLARGLATKCNLENGPQIRDMREEGAIATL